MYGVMQVLFLIEAVFVIAGITLVTDGTSIKNIVVGAFVLIMSFLVLLATVMMYFARNLSVTGMTRWNTDGTRESMSNINVGEGAASSYIRFENTKSLQNSNAGMIQPYRGGKGQ